MSSISTRAYAWAGGYREGASIPIVFTAAKILEEVIEQCQSSAVTFALARLESLRAQEAFVNLEIIELLGEGHVFLSIDEAIRALPTAS